MAKQKNTEFVVINKGAIDNVLRQIEKELMTISKLHVPENYNHIYDEMLTRRIVRVRAKVNLLYRLGIIDSKQKRKIDDMF